MKVEEREEVKKNLKKLGKRIKKYSDPVMLEAHQEKVKKQIRKKIDKYVKNEDISEKKLEALMQKADRFKKLVKSKYKLIKANTKQPPKSNTMLIDQEMQDFDGELVEYQGSRDNNSNGIADNEETIIVQRGWNDATKDERIKKNLKKGPFSPEEIMTLKKAICEYVKVRAYL